MKTPFKRTAASDDMVRFACREGLPSHMEAIDGPDPRCGAIEL